MLPSLPLGAYTRAGVRGNASVGCVWMPRPAEVFERVDPITADFTYIRWLGDRKGIELKTKTWDKSAVVRAANAHGAINCERGDARGVTLLPVCGVLHS